MKCMVYGTPEKKEEYLIERVHGAIESLTRQLHLWVVYVKLSSAVVGGYGMT